MHIAHCFNGHFPGKPGLAGSPPWLSASSDSYPECPQDRSKLGHSSLLSEADQWSYSYCTLGFTPPTTITKGFAAGVLKSRMTSCHATNSFEASCTRINVKITSYRYLKNTKKLRKQTSHKDALVFKQTEKLRSNRPKQVHLNIYGMCMCICVNI